MREELRSLLMQWKSGQVVAQFVLEQAEDLYDLILSAENLDPIEQEVVAQLSMLNQQLITAGGIPAFLELLATSAGNETEALRMWAAYLDAVDCDARSRQLKEPPCCQ